MAITSEDIQQQSFKIERRGYDVDEVDVFLEHVSDEIDALNNEIAFLRAQIDETASAPEPAPSKEASEEASPADASQLADKEARIAELESQLTERKSEDSAIAQALIIAQRTADEIVSKARSDGETIRRNAEEEGQRILDKAGAEKQRILEQISELTVSREKVREQYQDMLKEFIASSSKRLSEIGCDNTSDIEIPKELVEENAAPEQKWDPSPSTATYTTPTVNASVSNPAPPKPSQSSKDLSGYGDADDTFNFDEID
jgi:DivIVA domain-containing protein